MSNQLYKLAFFVSIYNCYNRLTINLNYVTIFMMLDAVGNAYLLIFFSNGCYIWNKMYVQFSVSIVVKARLV